MEKGWFPFCPQIGTTNVSEARAFGGCKKALELTPGTFSQTGHHIHGKF
jgi:hypothetical protein